MNNEIITKKYLINGANNVARLTNGKKVIYIFSNYYFDVNNQFECGFSDKYDSIDIDKLLLKFMKTEKTKNFDFFTEMFNYDYKEKTLVNNVKYNYIHEVWKLFQSKIEINNNKIMVNKKYPNFKFHFYDIKNILVDYNQIEQYYYFFNKNLPFTKIQLAKIYNCIKRLINNLNNLLLFLQIKDHEYIEKLFNSYENIEIKNKINEILKHNCIYNIKKTIKQSEKLLYLIESKKLLEDNYYDKNKNLKIQIDIYLKLDLILSNSLNIYSLLSDLFLIRRFLDKNYITNAIVYTGINNMNNIIYLLIKYFNFKLTNIYYSSENNIDTLNDLIFNLNSHNFQYIDTLYTIFHKDNYYKESKISSQCVNLFNFPDNFT